MAVVLVELLAAAGLEVVVVAVVVGDDGAVVYVAWARGLVVRLTRGTVVVAADDVAVDDADVLVDSLTRDPGFGLAHFEIAHSLAFALPFAAVVVLGQLDAVAPVSDVACPVALCSLSAPILDSPVTRHCR